MCHIQRKERTMKHILLHRPLFYKVLANNYRAVAQFVEADIVGMTGTSPVTPR